MSTLRLSHVKKKMQEMNIPLLIKIETNKKQDSLRRLSIALGMNKNFLNQKGRKHDYTVSELMALSLYLDANLFDWFIARLPESIRATKRETELQKQIDDMNEQMAKLIEERNMFRDAVLRK